MTDYRTQLRRELTDLNEKCQQARDLEVRYALQRSRLEAERTELLVKLIDEAAPTLPKAAPPPVIIREPAPASVAAPTAQRQTRKPAGTPYVSDMILTALETAPGGLKPAEITHYVRERWWPEAPSDHIRSSAWTMEKAGRLEKFGGRYKLNGHKPHN